MILLARLSLLSMFLKLKTPVESKIYCEHNLNTWDHFILNIIEKALSALDGGRTQIL
jgi:hypothetical protein